MKRSPEIPGLERNMDRRAIGASLAGRLKQPITAEHLAREIGAPLLLVQDELRKLARSKRVRAVDTATEDGERRIRFQEVSDV